MTKTLSSFLLPCHAELAKASLCLNPFYSYCFFWKSLFSVFSVAMQSFTLALWLKYCVHRYTCGNNHGVTNITPLRGWKRCSLLVGLWNWPHPRPLLIGEGRNISRPYCRTKVSPLRGDLGGHLGWIWYMTSPQPFSLRGNGAEEASSGMKAWPGNGSGVERGGGFL